MTYVQHGVAHRSGDGARRVLARVESSGVGSGAAGNGNGNACTIMLKAECLIPFASSS